MNGQIARNALTADTPDAQARANAEGKIINAEKLSIVRLADRLLREQPDAGGFSSYITISYEMLSQGNNAKALNYAKAALQNSETKPEEIESMRYIARVLFAPGENQNVSAARKTFQDARALSETEQSFLGPQLVANVLSDIVIAEILFGECKEAKLAMETLNKKLSTSHTVQVLQAALGEISYSVRGTTNCRGLFGR